MRMRPTLGGLTVVLLLLVGAAIYLADRHQKSVELEQADAVAISYAAELVDYQRRAHEDLIALDAVGDAAAMAEAAGRLTAELPALPQVGSHAAERSTAYRAAADRSAAVRERFDIAAEVAQEWALATPFVAAAREALDAQIPQSVVAGPVSDGGPVRRDLIPLMQQVKSRFETVAVPPGQEQLAAGVVDAVQFVIDEASAAARQLDEGQGASFSYGEQYQDALRPVLEYEAQLRQRVESALAGIAPPAPEGVSEPEPAPGDEI